MNLSTETNKLLFPVVEGPSYGGIDGLSDDKLELPDCFQVSRESSFGNSARASENLGFGRTAETEISDMSRLSCRLETHQ